MEGDICTLCSGLGWMLERDQTNDGQLRLIECPIPDCPASGREIELHLEKRTMRALYERDDEYLGVFFAEQTSRPVSAA